MIKCADLTIRMGWSGSIHYNNRSKAAGEMADALSVETLSVCKIEDPDRVGYCTTRSSEDFFDVRTCAVIPGTPYFCIVSGQADYGEARSEFFSTTLLPSGVALLTAIALFIGFTQLMIRPMKDISRVMNRAGEGVFSA